MKPKPVKCAGKWKPKIGEKVWYINMFDCIVEDELQDDSLVCKIYSYFGNCFRTKREAEAVLRKIRRNNGK